MDLSKATLEIFSKLEHNWLHHHFDAKNNKTRILAIDGAAGPTSSAAAIVSGAALIHLEDQIISRTGNSSSRISDLFELIAGTGTGGIYAALLSSSDCFGRPLFSARAAVEFVNELSNPKSSGGFLRRRRRRLSGMKMEKALKEALRRGGGDEKLLTLRDTCKPLLIPCFDLKSSSPFVFSRADANESDSFDFELWKVCRATSASPSIYKPFNLTSVDGKTSCLAVDGGLAMNNPAAAAVTHVLNNKRDFPSVHGVEDLLVLSLGDGTVSNYDPKVGVRRNGECSMGLVVGIALDGISETVDQMLGNAFSWNRTDYVRIQASNETTGRSELNMERVLSERGMESLPFGGKRLMTENNGQRIENFVQRLIASGKTSLPPSPCKKTAITPLVNGR